MFLGKLALPRSIWVIEGSCQPAACVADKEVVAAAHNICFLRA
jgi:hypothetical protein